MPAFSYSNHSTDKTRWTWAGFSHFTSQAQFFSLNMDSVNYLYLVLFFLNILIIDWSGIIRSSANLFLVL